MPILTGTNWNWNLEHVMRWNERGKNFKNKLSPILFPNTQIVTLGSCFMRYLTDAMVRQNLNCIMHPSGLYYSSSSIRQEFERVFEPIGNTITEDIWKTDQGYMHPHKSYFEFFKTPEALKKWSQEIDEKTTGLFRKADVFVIILGLIEVWMNEKTKTVYRHMPPPSIIAENGISLSRLTVKEMLEDLEKIYKIIKMYTNADVILGVSPVPMNATMTDLDVRIANIESKSRIRAAVSEFIEEHPDVFYFHSYEIVATAEKPMDFMLEDGRHLSKTAFDYITNQFLQVFASDEIVIKEIDSSWIAPPTKLALRPKRSFIQRLPKSRKEFLSIIKKIKKTKPKRT